MFVNLHILFTMTGANPNRDDAGAPKTLIYGDVERSRISSQSMTRAKRLALEKDSRGELSYRSKKMPLEILTQTEKILLDNGKILSEDERAKLFKKINDAVTKLVTDKEKKEGALDDKDDAKDTLIWLGESEVLESAKKFALKYLKDENADFFSEDIISIGNKKTESLSIAAFGRMFAMRPDLQNEAAIQRASAFTTHRAEIDVDFFTAVDDLLALEDAGAGHLGLKMHTGGVYYWHANIDINQLLSTWTGADSPEVNERLAALLEALILALPSGGEATHAHHVLPSFVMLSKTTRPISLQSAFEQPVSSGSDGGYLENSIEALESEHKASYDFAPHLFLDTPIYLGMNVKEIDSLEKVSNLKEASDKVVSWIVQEKNK